MKLIERWHLLLISILFGIIFFSCSETIDDNELESYRITLSNDIEYIKHRQKSGGSKYFRLWTNEHHASFIIKRPGIAASDNKLLQDLKKGDTLVVKIHQSRTSELKDKSSEIPIYYLKNNNAELFNPQTYTTTSAAIDRRVLIILSIVVIIITLKWMNWISGRTSLILAGIALVGIIVLKQLQLW